MSRMPAAEEQQAEELDAKQLKEKKKQLKLERKQQKKEAKEKARELASQEADLDEDESKPLSTFLITALIVLVWLGILCLLIRLDVGGFGSGVLKPVLKDVPVINYILPTDKMATPGEGDDISEEADDTAGYKNLKEAVAQIKFLEQQLADAEAANATYTEDIDTLKAEVERLKTFEDNQVEFQQAKNEFYEEVVYADKGPGAEAYQKYYETMDPTTAENLYKQVIQQVQESKEVEDYAKAYAAMKPKEAAAIFESMTENLDLAARILETMGADDRGKILGVMDATVAARLTKIMEPAS
ncbi:MAG: hypothetical protein PHS74_09710 [Lachnospiraceae bacterium]|nr:hypothetical protein [Lachnospiraceae bacterium]